MVGFVRVVAVDYIHIGDIVAAAAADTRIVNTAAAGPAGDILRTVDILHRTAAAVDNLLLLLHIERTDCSRRVEVEMKGLQGRRSWPRE